MPAKKKAPSKKPAGKKTATKKAPAKKAVTKRARRKKVAKPAAEAPTTPAPATPTPATPAPEPVAKKKTGSRGKRYTAKAKAEVIAFVNEVNADKGRGGAAAASRKFGITQITIGRWAKKSPAASPAPSGKKTATKAPAASASLEQKLAKLGSIHADILRTEKQLADLRAQFDRIKVTL
ncbi:hypothetical protein [Haloferula sp. A504]|uniref:hypothetical protein n=1 Tax=Haloferula sp. A504 TaxID=3373601 RepID=UPI0031CA02D7|nr:hypothetical protein [Verrucomicrobiaceae bacterium E54]